jgi:hypothetical protein
MYTREQDARQASGGKRDHVMGQNYTAVIKQDEGGGLVGLKKSRASTARSVPREALIESLRITHVEALDLISPEKSAKT